MSHLPCVFSFGEQGSRAFPGISKEEFPNLHTCTLSSSLSANWPVQNPSADCWSVQLWHRRCHADMYGPSGNTPFLAHLHVDPFQLCFEWSTLLLLRHSQLVISLFSLWSKLLMPVPSRWLPSIPSSENTLYPQPVFRNNLKWLLHLFSLYSFDLPCSISYLFPLSQPVFSITSSDSICYTVLLLAPRIVCVFAAHRITYSLCWRQGVVLPEICVH